jgi:hypothetical protein
MVISRPVGLGSYSLPFKASRWAQIRVTSARFSEPHAQSGTSAPAKLLPKGVRLYSTRGSTSQ